MIWRNVSRYCHAALLITPLVFVNMLFAGNAHSGALPEPLSTFRDCDECPEMVVLPTGSFIMGATDQEQKDMFIGFVPSEHPAREVSIGYPFAIGRFEVTTDQFTAYVEQTGAKVGGTCGIRLMEKGKLAKAFTGTRHPDDGKIPTGPFFVFISDGSFEQPGLPVTGNQPAVCVSRIEILGYLDWLGEKTGRSYRLPSEAEWEYAARAGTRTIGFWGDDLGKACDYANFGDRNSGYQAGMAAPCGEAISPAWTAAVGSYEPNGWGIHDMAGNVQELTADCWFDSYEGAPADGAPRLKEDCSLYVARGGDYQLLHVSMRASERLFYGYVAESNSVEGPDAADNGRSNVMGFRVAVSLDDTAWDKR